MNINVVIYFFVLIKNFQTSLIYIFPPVSDYGSETREI